MLSCTPPPRYLGLDAYRHLDKLSYLSIGDRVAGESTADPARANADSAHILRTLPDGARVLFDQTGPGILTFMRMQESFGGPWRLYLDGAHPVTVTATDLGRARPGSFPASTFPFPLSMNSAQTQGSSIIADAIPFRDRVQWMATAPNGNFYALYDRLPYGTPLPTWNGHEHVGDVVQLLRRAGSDIAPASAARISGTINLPAGRETALARLSGGPEQIRALQFRVPSAEQTRLGDARLRIYWDGEATPSVDAPVKFMAGDGAGVYQPANRPLVRGLLASAGGDGRTSMMFSLYWPMPFHAIARITLSSSTPLAGIRWAVQYEPFRDPPNWWGTFHATYTSVPTPRPGEDMTFLNVHGSGRIVGTVVNFTRIGSTLEGNPSFYLDDSQTPQIEVTGTEEWGLGGDYWHDGMQTSLPLGGLPSSTNNPPGAAIDGAALYRFLVADSIPFNRSAVVRWEHGAVDESTDPYRAVVFWYGTPARTALLSDTLRVGDAASRAAHAYRSPSGHAYRLTAAYGYGVHSPPFTEAGASMTGASTFRMALDPRNVGAFLRRTFDYGFANQRANIFIDGHFAGTWYSAGSFQGRDGTGQQRRWREEDFPLPPALTAGKSVVTIRVQYVPTTNPPDRAWTEFSYQMYSFVLPGCPR